MADRLDLVFKKIVGRNYSAAAKAWYEENPGVPFKLKGSDVWVDSIPEIPPVENTSVIECYTDGNRFALTKDESVNDNRAWFAKQGETKLGNFISPRYGQGYTARVFDANGTEIPTTHACGWFFDFESGILTFDVNPSTWYNASGFTVHTYRYIGATADDLAESMSGSVWQEPVTSFSNDAPTTPAAGDRYIVGPSPTGGDVFEGHSSDIAEYNGVTWKFIPPKSGMIVYVVDQDKLYLYDNDVNGWGYSGIDAVDLDYDNSGSDLDQTTVKAALDELDRLIKSTTYTVRVDSSRTDSYVETGSVVKPFKSITGAISAIGIPADVVENKEAWTIIASSGNYDEDVTIPAARNIRLLTDGTVVLGDGSGSYYTDSTTPRSITWETNSTLEFGDHPRPTLTIGRVGGKAIGTHRSYSDGFIITGDVIVNSTGGEATSKELTFHGCDILGEVNSSTDLGLVNCYGFGTRFKGGINGTNMRLQTCEDVVFRGTVIVDGYSRISGAEFDGSCNMTITQIASDVSPTGIFNSSVLSGFQFTGPAESFRCDSVTWATFQDNGGVFAGLASRYLLDRASGVANLSTVIKQEANGDVLGGDLHDTTERLATVTRYDSGLGSLIIDPCVDDI